MHEESLELYKTFGITKHLPIPLTDHFDEGLTLGQHFVALA